jgi:hypothetical protein
MLACGRGTHQVPGNCAQHAPGVAGTQKWGACDNKMRDSSDAQGPVRVHSACLSRVFGSQPPASFLDDWWIGHYWRRMKFFSPTQYSTSIPA